MKINDIIVERVENENPEIHTFSIYNQDRELLASKEGKEQEKIEIEYNNLIFVSDSDGAFYITLQSLKDFINVPKLVNT